MIAKIAWRNIWRSPGRTITIVLAVTIGVSSLAFLTGFINGFIESFVANGIKSEYSHVQIHHPDYKTDRELKYNIPNGKAMIHEISKDPRVEAVSGRTIVNGMISSTKSATGISIYGIDLEQESSTTGIDSALIAGSYFQNISRNPILISTDLADKLKLKERSKLVLTFTNAEGDIVAGAFRVDGIFESKSVKINKGTVFVRKSDLLGILGAEEVVHEIGILLKSFDSEPAYYDSLKNAQPELLVENWAVIAPDLELMQGQVWISMSVVLVIIMAALCFGIINTMLMAVLERVKELGMLMAVGMSKSRVFKMIVMESFIMAFIGAPLGILVGSLINYYFAVNGLDLTAYSEGLKEYGYDSVLYTSVAMSDYLLIAGAVAITAILASIYPARKAIKLKPIEALHTI